MPACGKPAWAKRFRHMPMWITWANTIPAPSALESSRRASNRRIWNNPIHGGGLISLLIRSPVPKVGQCFAAALNSLISLAAHPPTMRRLDRCGSWRSTNPTPRNPAPHSALATSHLAAGISPFANSSSCPDSAGARPSARRADWAGQVRQSRHFGRMTAGPILQEG